MQQTTYNATLIVLPQAITVKCD